MRHHDDENNLGPNTGELSVDDLKRAEKEIVMCVRREAFKEHFSQVLKSKSPLRRLCPILIDGILCVGGRLQNVPITGRKNGFTRVTKVQQKCSKYHICRNLLKFAEEQRLILH